MTNYLTKEGLLELQAELERLTKVDLPEILDSINKAMAEGDISENSALDSAKLDRDKILTRQAEIEEILNDYQIIEDAGKNVSKTVHIGGTVKIQYLSDNRLFTLRIVGASEADALNGKISNESPLALAILGKKEGQEVSFKVKQGKISVKILEIVS